MQNDSRLAKNVVWGTFLVSFETILNAPYPYLIGLYIAILA